MNIKNNPKDIIEDIYDIIMKNDRYSYEWQDFTQYDDAYLDQHYNTIVLGEYTIKVVKTP